MARILIVDDSRIFADEAAEYFERWGWSVQGADDGNKGMDALKKDDFDAVILDRNMPGPSGDDVLRWIRGQERLQDLCVIYYTGYAQTESAVQALKLGAFQYLQKPTDFTLLRSIVSAGIAWHRVHALRRELLACFDRKVLFEKVRAILRDTMNAEGVYILFVDRKGDVEIVLGAPVDQVADRRPDFVSRIPGLIFEQDSREVIRLGPLVSNAKTLMAVPVKDATGVIGVLDMESLRERAFDPSWTEVLSYLAGLIGIALYISKQADELKERDAKAAFQKVEIARISGLYREMRHNIATPAQIIAMQARELEADYSKPATERVESKIRQRLGYIRDNVEIVELAMEELKDISSPPRPLDLKAFDLLELLRGCAGQLEDGDVRESHIKFVLPEDACFSISADRPKLRYCFDCLFRNAIEAIEADRLRSSVPAADREDIITVRVHETSFHLEVSIEDTGIGFDPVDKDLLFQPAYSTKTKRPEGKRTGTRLRGAARVTRLLSLMSAFSQTQSYSEQLDALVENERADILIRDGQSVSMRVNTGIESHEEWLPVIETGEALRGDPSPRGAGLYSVRRLIGEHGGTILASSDGWRGATFVITLPRNC